jgi:hypothetical protein
MRRPRPRNLRASLAFVLAQRAHARHLRRLVSRLRISKHSAGSRPSQDSPERTLR